MAKQSLGYAEDDYGGYEWGFAEVFSEDGRFYIVADSGCSCNGPESSYSERDAVVGPARTLGGLFDELYVDSNKHSLTVKKAFIEAMKRLNEETLETTKKALGVP